MKPFVINVSRPTTAKAFFILGFAILVGFWILSDNSAPSHYHQHWNYFDVVEDFLYRYPKLKLGVMVGFIALFLYVLMGYVLRLSHRGPLLILDETGIENTLSGCGRVHWADLVARPSIGGNPRNPTLQIAVRSPEAYLKKMPFYKRLLPGFGFDPFKFWLIWYEIQAPELESYLKEIQAWKPNDQRSFFGAGGAGA